MLGQRSYLNFAFDVKQIYTNQLISISPEIIKEFRSRQFHVQS